MTKTVHSKTRIRLGALQEDLNLEPGVIVEAQGSTVNVAGIVKCDGDVHFKGDLTARALYGNKGRITIDGSAKIADKISVEEGSLEVSGSTDARTINIDEAFSVGKDLHTDAVEVGGSVHVAGPTTARLINVGGVLECKGKVDVGEVLVGNILSIDGESKIGRLDVGGSVKLAGGTVTGRIEVDGVLQSTRPLSFAEMDVGGSIVLTGSNKGGDIRIGVRAKIDGDLEFRTLWVSGRMQVTGSCRGFSAEVGGALEVGKTFEVADSLKVGARIVIGDRLSSRSLELAGTLDARLATIEENARIGGMISTRDGLRASRIETASNWEVRGPLIGNEIQLGTNADVEDVYAHDLRMADGAKASNIYSTRIQIGDNCKVEKAIEYTESLKIGKGLSSEPGMPRKVKDLPSFPLTDHSKN